MIVIDTNVISELMQAEPNPLVFAFIDAQPRAALYTASIVQAEILSGIAQLPQGRRRAALDADAQRLFAEEFAGRVLPFDQSAAIAYAAIIQRRRTIGHPLEGFDGLIAAITAAAGFTVATRNTADFADCGVPLINPWEAQ
jgi:predicted nucleic acid-binding protein